MNQERRRYPRHETEFGARIYTDDLDLSVTVVDINDRGINIISKRPIGTGSKVLISLFPISKDPIMGIPIWSFRIKRDQKYFYRTGIEIENLHLEKIQALGLPKRSKFVSEILFQT